MKTSHKIIAAMLIVTGATIHLSNTGYADWNAGGNSFYAGTLGLLFFWKEETEDERVKTLKLWATTVAFMIAYCVTVLLKVLAGTKLVPHLPTTISAFDFMFVMVVTAFAFFHYWRWQDGRADRTG